MYTLNFLSESKLLQFWFLIYNFDSCECLKMTNIADYFEPAKITFAKPDRSWRKTKQKIKENNTFVWRETLRYTTGTVATYIWKDEYEFAAFMPYRGIYLKQSQDDVVSDNRLKQNFFCYLCKQDGNYTVWFPRASIMSVTSVFEQRLHTWKFMARGTNVTVTKCIKNQV